MPAWLATCPMATLAFSQDSFETAPCRHAALVALAVAPLLVAVPPNVNIVVTACLTVLVGCWRSVKPEPPPEAMSKKVCQWRRRR